MDIRKSIKAVKDIQAVFPNGKIMIITDDPDPAKNLETAKAFGKAGIQGTWRTIKHKDNHER